MRRPEQTAPSIFVRFVKEIADTKTLSKREAMLVREGEHILHGLVPFPAFDGLGVFLRKSFERARNDLFRRPVTALPELLLDQARTAGIEAEIHKPLVYMIFRAGDGGSSRLKPVLVGPDGSKPREVLKRPDWVKEVEGALR
jgi:hypothetical protein